jgi:glutathione S-transferase
MKLYSVDFSPYAARVRLQIYEKQLPVQVVAVPGGLGSEQQRGLTPLGKIPVLELDDGTRLGESQVIMEYLEAVIPQLPLLPSEPLALARVRMKASVATNYLTPILLPLFLKLKYPDKDAVSADEYLAQLSETLLRFDLLLEQGGYDEAGFNNRGLDLADCCLVPVFYFVESLPRLFQREALHQHLPNVSQWWQRVGQLQSCQRVIYELERGFQTYLCNL